ncbi:SGNH hydrolase-type esterase domain-containing protein [Fusarium redolens]|uniref:SGNH hydrolase-type esterase domain-containing protein n=1 Tax=Fusarium redolens TaxID=48865 RepID=A0A9P9KVA8_FUSRE|nr:SGNH hydrolase-type esterase domain-containing protein [Fusarium redolens]KAH7269119.1 SGNH hydrolase-type esterase domain-containing protein [Fusarium redolens]
MRFSTILGTVLLAAPIQAAKLLICSDSTTANYATGNALQGWGFYIQDYTTLTVSNLAKNGRSTRSFINEGLWKDLLSKTASGDFVVIEMGHNDDGDPTASDRATLPGTGEETVTVTTTTGSKEVVHTFGWYLRKMIADVKAKGATPILSGMVNRNYWTGNTLQSKWPFADYAEAVAKAAGVEYINHTNYSVALFQAMGPTKAKTYYPNDNTHTNWDGAKLNTQTFVQAVKYKCGRTSVLKKYVNAAGNAIKSPAQQSC